jgi:endoglucanase
MENISQSIAPMGFNCVRLDFSTEMFYSNPVITNASVLAANKDFIGKRAMDIFDAAVESLTSNGVMVILNNHIGKAQWCCSETDGEGLWYTQEYPEQMFFNMWTALALRYKSNMMVIGADLRNELRVANRVKPTWGSGNKKTDWAIAATTCGNAILNVNSNWLIIVEGLSYATDLSGASTFPIKLSKDHKLVYSAHDYSWSQTASSYYQFESMMNQKWGYLISENKPYTAPVWVGEFGENTDSEWWGWMIRYLWEKDMDWAYWSLDGEQRLGVDESFGIFMQDYATIRHEWKLSDLKGIQQVTIAPVGRGGVGVGEGGQHPPMMMGDDARR